MNYIAFITKGLSLFMHITSCTLLALMMHAKNFSQANTFILFGSKFWQYIHLLNEVPNTPLLLKQQ